MSLVSRIFMYAHGGSENHGCEAIVRSTVNILNNLSPEYIGLITERPSEDRKYGLSEWCDLIQEKSEYPRKSVDFILAYLKLKLSNNYIPLDKLQYKMAFDHMQYGDIALSIGGDNYCYADVQRYVMMHDMALARGAKTVLWGCSVEPELLNNAEIARDIARYSLITARESISYEALKKVNPNTILVYDSAFALPCDTPCLPSNFMQGNMVGINLSPMVMDNESKPGIVLESYETLIKYILETTDMGVALIPHVVWENGDDRVPLQKLYDRYVETGRVVMVENQSCTKLKAVISHCSFFVGARTHATIAAYSTGVPTLVVGYSVKARGIARDLFGTEEGYVLPVQKLSNPNELLNAFKSIIQRPIKNNFTDSKLRDSYTNVLERLSKLC